MSFQSATITRKADVIPGGQKKPNQDSYASKVQATATVPTAMFAVCDGHGKHGHKASVLVARHLQESDMCVKDLRWKLASELKDAERRLEVDFEMELSGTTAVVVVIQSDGITCANIGDSRAILGRRSKVGGSIQYTARSEDHTPSVPSEKQRITSEYGDDAISRATDARGEPVGPERVWLAGGSGLGLAMTRSLGDIEGKKAGVSPVPEFRTAEHAVGDSCIILASDGLWDMIESEEALSIAMQAHTPHTAATKLKKLALERWKIEEGAVVDDITLTVVFLQSVKSDPAAKERGLPDQHGRPGRDWRMLSPHMQRRSSSSIMSPGLERTVVHF